VVDLVEELVDVGSKHPSQAVVPAALGLSEGAQPRSTAAVGERRLAQVAVEQSAGAVQHRSLGQAVAHGRDAEVSNLAVDRHLAHEHRVRRVGAVADLLLQLLDLTVDPLGELVDGNPIHSGPGRAGRDLGPGSPQDAGLRGACDDRLSTHALV
jgi:hypothetical protein